jgi:hypothetical protein
VSTKAWALLQVFAACLSIFMMIVMCFALNQRDTARRDLAACRDSLAVERIARMVAQSDTTVYIPITFGPPDTLNVFGRRWVSQ